MGGRRAVFKRRIPRVAVATMSLGGAVGAGCAQSHHEGEAGGRSTTEAFCTHLFDCYADYGYVYDQEYVAECAAAYDRVLSYYSGACERAIRRLFECYNDLSCHELFYEWYLCDDEYYRALDACDIW
jgi:hypothetical protein